MRVLRARQLGDSFLRHSEWTRSIGLPSAISLACVFCVPLAIFVVMPVCLASLAGPSTLISLLIAFLALFLSVSHLTELSCAVPKNCVSYHCCFALVGELPSFILAWVSIADAAATSSLLVTAWSNHLNLLFREGIRPATSLQLFHKDSPSWILTDHFDLFAVLGIVMALMLLCCNLKVMGTVSLCFLCVTVLIISSCTMVSFFHADPQNWIDANFFSFGALGVFRAACALMVAFSGVEGITYMLEETKNPRGRLTTLLPLLTTTLSVVFFLVIMIFSLAINVSTLSPTTLVPEWFTQMNVPAARYMLTVASVCGLSGAALASFLPGSRLLTALSTDGLLPLPSDPQSIAPVSLLLYSLLISFSLLLRTDILWDIVCFTTPLKIIVTICLTYLQHYRPEPIGIPHETSQYRSMCKQTRRVSASGSFASGPLDSQYSMDTAVFVQMNIAHIEANRYQTNLEECQRQEMDERAPVLSSSVSQYNTIAKSRVCESGFSALNGGHNCVAEACSPTDENHGGRIHLYHREVPEMPFVDSTGGRPSTPIHMGMEYSKAQGTLWLFLFSTSLFALLLLRIDHHSPSSLVLLCLFLSLTIVSVVITSRIPTNDYLYRRQARVPMFPHISFATLFLLILCISSLQLRLFIPLLGWLSIGLVIYFSYGMWFSTERNMETRPIDSTENSEYRAIIGDDTSEMM